LKTQIPIDYQTTSRIKFYSFDLLGVLGMDCLLEAVINYSKSPNQTYKSLLHRFCSPTNGYLLPNIQLVFGILHQWISFFSSRQQVQVQVLRSLTSHVCCLFQNGANQLRVEKLCKNLTTPQNNN
jgi:hypothetical protein